MDVHLTDNHYDCRVIINDVTLRALDVIQLVHANATKNFVSLEVDTTITTMACTFLLGTFNEIPGTDEKNFVVLGTYQDKDQAKQAVTNLAPSVMQDQYKNGITMYELKHDQNKVYTFQKKDLEKAYSEIQKQQQQQLESQKEQLKQQQEQIQKQIDSLKSGDNTSAPGNVQAPPPISPAPMVNQ